MMGRRNKNPENYDMEENSSRVFHRSLLFSYFLLLFIVLIVIILVGVSSRKFSQFSREKEHTQLQTLLKEETASLSALTLEYGWWNEAIIHMILNHNEAWAEENFTGYLTEKYGISWILPFDMEGNLYFGKHDDDSVETSPLSLFDRSIRSLIEEAQNCDLSDPVPASGIMKVDGELHFVSVSVFAAYSPTILNTEIPHGYLILSRRVDSTLLKLFSSQSGVNDLALTVGGTDPGDIYDSKIHHLSLYDPEGMETGALHWPKNSAIREHFRYLLELTAVMMVCLSLISLFFFRNLYRYYSLTKGIIHSQKSSNVKLSFQANYDELTSLTNRHLFVDRLEQSINRCRRNGTVSALLFMDLDGFKGVNDTLGHESGDELLIQVGKRLKNLVRAQDTVSRFGGDEFCIILEDIKKAENADLVLSKILELFEHPFILAGEAQYLGVSIGVVFVPGDGNDTVSLLRFADIAMYQAKKESGSRYVYFNPELDMKTHRRSLLKTGLRNAIDRGELHLEYQPIYELKDRTLDRVEALVRWKSPDMGLISPEEFIPMAEETGLIRELGYWIIERSIMDILEINAAANSRIKVSINISVSQLRETDFLERFLSLIEKQGIEPALVHLEITENILIDESIIKSRILERLNDLGFKLVMDDFGTGYSSLGYIQKIPLKSIKIDKSFVSGSMENTKSGALIKTIIYMAKAFRLDTVAEGIETGEQENFLLASGCLYGQGFLYSCPKDRDKIIAMINENSVIMDKAP